MWTNSQNSASWGILRAEVHTQIWKTLFVNLSQCHLLKSEHRFHRAGKMAALGHLRLSKIQGKQVINHMMSLQLFATSQRERETNGKWNGPLINAIKRVGSACCNIALAQEFPCHEPMYSAQENHFPLPFSPKQDYSDFSGNESYRLCNCPSSKRSQKVLACAGSWSVPHCCPLPYQQETSLAGQEVALCHWPGMKTWRDSLVLLGQGYFRSCI